MSYSPRSRGLSSAPSRGVMWAALVTYLVLFLCVVAFWVGVAWIAWHFIAKWW